MNIRRKAEQLLRETGLTEALCRYGEAYVTGSYLMDMMTWNDLDIYLKPDEAGFDMYSMIASVNSALRPVRFDGMVRQEEKIFFYGAETVFRGERWNVDIWVKEEREIREGAIYCEEIMKRVRERPELRKAIIEIKKALMERGMYGMDKHPQRHYHSREIYDAVLNENIFSTEEFLEKHPLDA